MLTGPVEPLVIGIEVFQNHFKMGIDVVIETNAQKLLLLDLNLGSGEPALPIGSGFIHDVGTIAHPEFGMSPLIVTTVHDLGDITATIALFAGGIEGIVVEHEQGTDPLVFKSRQDQVKPPVHYLDATGNTVGFYRTGQPTVTGKFGFLIHAGNPGFKTPAFEHTGVGKFAFDPGQSGFPGLDRIAVDDTGIVEPDGQFEPSDVGRRVTNLGVKLGVDITVADSAKRRTAAIDPPPGHRNPTGSCRSGCCPPDTG